MKLSSHDRSVRVWFMMKIRQDNDVTNRMGLVYDENDTELLGSIGLGAVCDETRQDNNVIDHINLVYI